MLQDNSVLLAYTYIWGEKDDPDLYGDWDFEVNSQCSSEAFSINFPLLPPLIFKLYWFSVLLQFDNG